MKKLHVACLALVLAAQVTIACGEELPGTPPEEGDSSTGNKGNTGNTSNTGATDAGGGDGPSSGGKGGKGSGGKAPTGGTQGQGGGEDDLFAHCNQPWSGEPPPVETECDLDALEDSGVTITTAAISAGMTLESGKIYKLSGPTRILPGKTLTIPPCVKIIGQSPESVLAVSAGDDTTASGQLIAIGEPMAPIIFTSAQPPGSRSPGDWGGVMMLGRAQVNNVMGGVRPKAEGLEVEEPYGWVTDEFNDDSSGSLAYVRIEYASRQINADSETNGLTFAGVGTGTSAHHVMVSNSADDCFEWFGGKMDAHHLIALNCDDDMFDTDAGFTGTIQFAFGRMYSTTAELDSSGFEMDNLSSALDAQPRTAAQWSNVTLCGTNDRSASQDSTRFGMVLRRGLGGSITNTLVTGFSGAFSKRDGQTIIGLNHVTEFENFKVYAQAGGTELQGWFEQEDTNSSEAPDRFCNCWANPPVPFAATPVEGGDPGFGDTDATYRGAFKDASAESNWMTGLWVDWSDE
jgi:hypothetical protein